MALHPSKFERFSVGAFALVLVWALLAPAPSHAGLASTGDAPPREIGAGAFPCAGALPSPPERTRGAGGPIVVSLHLLVEAKAADASAFRVTTLVGGAPPALARWRLAHGTATSSP